MSLLWLRVAVLLYGIAALAVLPAALYDRPRWRHVAIPAAIAGALLPLRLPRRDAQRRPPLASRSTPTRPSPSLASSLPSPSCSSTARYRTVSLGIFLLPIAFLLALAARLPPRPGNRRLPAVRTPAGSSCTSRFCSPPTPHSSSRCCAAALPDQERRLKSKSHHPPRPPAAAARNHRPDRPQGPALRPALHDRRPAHRLRRRRRPLRRRLLPRPQDPARLRHVDRLHRR